MAKRDLLHESRLDDFKEWLCRDGWVINRPIANSYEVLRARKQSKGFLIIYRRDSTHSGNPIKHYSVDDKWTSLIRRFLNESKNN
jgi:hypothetical protein